MVPCHCLYKCWLELYGINPSGISQKMHMICFAKIFIWKVLDFLWTCHGKMVNKNNEDRLISVPCILLRFQWVNPHSLGCVLPHQYAMHAGALITAIPSRHTKDWLLFKKYIIFLYCEWTICQLNWVKMQLFIYMLWYWNIFMSYYEGYFSNAYQH